MRGLGGLWVRQPLSQRATIRDARAPNPHVASLPSFGNVLRKSARWRRRAPRRARSGAIVDEADPRACARGVVARPRATVASHASGRQASSPARPRRAPACAGRSRRSRGARSPCRWWTIATIDLRVLRPLNIDTEQAPRHRRARSPRRPPSRRALLSLLLLLLRRPCSAPGRPRARGLRRRLPTRGTAGGAQTRAAGVGRGRHQPTRHPPPAATSAQHRHPLHYHGSHRAAASLPPHPPSATLAPLCQYTSLRTPGPRAAPPCLGLPPSRPPTPPAKA